MQKQATICLGTQTSPVNRLVFFRVISSYDYMFQLLDKVKLYTTLARETVHKVPISIHIKCLMICRLPSTYKSIFTTGT